MILKHVFVRTLLLGVALISMFWSSQVFVGSGLSHKVSVVGQGIQAGETYPEEQMVNLLQEAALSTPNFCDTKRLNGQLFTQLKLAELSLNGQNTALLEKRLEAVSSTANNIIKCSPLHGFAWLALYWSAVNGEGFDDKALRYLIHSYDVAPREGWIGAKRNIFGLRAFDLLAPTLQSRVVLEWEGLVKNFLFEAAAVSLIEAPQALRLQFLARQTEIDDRNWRLFVRHLDRSGLDIPELVISEDRRRLWR